MINVIGNYTLKNKNNASITESTQFVGTKSKLTVGTTEYTIVVLGDVDGNGKLTVNDMANIYSHIKAIDQGLTTTLDSNELISADYDRNGRINVNDIANVYSTIKNNE